MVEEICPKCGLPKSLCVCGVIEREEKQIKIYESKRRWGKVMTIVEGIGEESGKQISKKLKRKLACVIPSTPVITKNGVKPISGISSKDLVLTSEKKYEKPIAVHNRDFKGKIIQLYPFYSNLPISLSPEHPVLAIPVKECEVEAWKTKCLPDCQGHHYVRCSLPFKKYEPEWIPCDSLKKWDLIAYPRFKDSMKNFELKLSEVVDEPFELKGNRIRSKYKGHELLNVIKVDENFARLAGYYVAEGESREDRVCFSFNSKEKELQHDTIDLMKGIFGINSFSRRELKGEEGIKIIFCSGILASFFKQLFTTGAANKSLPSWFINLKNSVLKEFVKGYYLGDGRTKQGGEGYVYTISTASMKLAFQVQQIFHKLGIICGMKIYSKKGEKHRWKGRVIERKHDKYTLYIPAWYRKRLVGIVGLPFEKTRKKRPQGWVDDEYVYICLRKIKRERYRGKLHNLGMPNDTYTARGMIVHNCGGTFKEGRIELQGNHVEKTKELLKKMGFKEEQIEIS